MRDDNLERECFTCTAEPKPRCRTCHATLLARLLDSQQALADALAELREARAENDVLVEFDNAVHKIVKEARNEQ
jgi:hypothetical protein